MATFNHPILTWTIPMVILLSAVFLLFLRWLSTVTIEFLFYKLPPGPQGLPILGCLTRIDKDVPLHIILTNMAKPYGKIFSLRLGERLTFVVSSKEVMKEALELQGMTFSGRPRFLTFKETKGGFDKGLSLRDYDSEYKQNKKLIHSGFKALFHPRGNFYTILTEECKKLVAEISNFSVPFDPQPVFRKAAASTFLRLAFGDNYSYDNKELLDFISIMQEWFEIAESNNPADFINVFRYLPNERLKKAKQINERFDNYCKHRLMRSMQGEQEYHGYFSSSFVAELTLASGYLETTCNKQEKAKALECLASRYASVITDMIGGAFDTVPSTLSWMILYLNENIKAKETIIDEVRIEPLDKVEDFLSLKKSPYLTASVYEAIRHSTVAPLGLPHLTRQDAKVCGYDVPKNSLVLINLWAINHSPSLWTNPDQFDPSRYLIDETIVDLRAIKSVSSFSAGIRKCPGERLAIAKLQAFIGTILRNFDFKIFEAPRDMEPEKGLTSRPKPYKIVLT